MARPWTAREDALLREHAAKGPGWMVESGLLPGRRYASICARRKHLGIQFSRGGAQTGQRKRQRPTSPATPWTDEQRGALLCHATAMCNDSGHTFRECMLEIARLQREHAEHGSKREGKTNG